MMWFDVDKAGLSKLLARKSKAFVVFELLQNSWDQNVNRVDVTLEKPRGARYVELRVEDDDADGFSDLRHAYTLFAESGKKRNPELRGRFNFGEKLVLALCKEAEITTTKGCVRFDKSGRQYRRARTAAGSRFYGKIPMTTEEYQAVLSEVRRVIPPTNITTRLNGDALLPRHPVFEFEASLPTDIADSDGYLKRRQRITRVRLFEPLENEVAGLYELGIPVVETGDRYHMDVQQKVPLSLERDNVPASYLRSLRTLTLNVAYPSLVEDDASAPWVREALQDTRCSREALTHAIQARFGERAVAYDPSDPEANKRAVAAGYDIVHGGHLSKAEWDNVRAAQVLSPAGQVTPTPKPFSDDPCAPSLTILEPHQWSIEEKNRVSQIQYIGRILLSRSIGVQIADDRDWPFDATYGDRSMIINRGKLGKRWFIGPLEEHHLALILHELGHHYESDHLSDRYHDALCHLGARLALSSDWQQRK